MKSSVLCDGKVLIVGDGDFSFTVSLVKHCNLEPHQVYTSNLETEATILHHAQASGNMTSLKDLGVSVFLETDATDLHNHAVISRESFDRIIFNFPLADRHNIKKNRSLLADFFSSCRSVLALGGRVLVTLCKGQGGTPADQPVRSWHDSWQIVAMATNASFLLSEVLPFDPTEFPEYHSVGFRFQDKSFNVTGALTHVFEKGTLVEDEDLNIRGTLERDGQSYSCSSYVASHLKRNLLEESRNPVCILRQNIEEVLRNSMPTERLFVLDGCNPVIPSHKSKAFIFKEETDVSTVVEDRSDDISNKEWKNYVNLKRMTKFHLAHGVIYETNDAKADCSGAAESTTAVFVPSDRDNVYILVKAKIDSSGSEITSSCEDEEECKLEDYNDHGEKDPNASGASTNDLGKINESASEKCCVVEAPVTQTHCTSGDSSSLIHHCRTSMLENLQSLCQIMIDRKETESTECSRNVSVCMGVETDKNLATTDSFSTSVSHSESHGLPRNPFPAMSSFPCLVTSGQSMLPCPITPTSSPMKHEMVILQQIENNDCGSISPLENNSVSASSNCSHQSHFNHASSYITSVLQSLNNDSPYSLTVSKYLSLHKLTIEGFNESLLDSQITVTTTTDSDGFSKNDEVSNSFLNQNAPECVGLILRAQFDGRWYHVTVVDLQKVACRLFGINDWRLLWSSDDKFLNQFQQGIEKAKFPAHQCYRPFSLYPMRFAHDLSFWVKSGRQGDREGDPLDDFDVFGLYGAIRSVVGDLVVNVSLIDVYNDQETGRRSHCYRLHFLSPDKCLPYVTSWKMQSKIRMEVARSLGIQLR